MSVEQRLDNIERMLQMILKSTHQGEQPGEIIDIEEAAKICKLNVRTLYNYIHSGRMNIPVQSRGKKLEFRRTDVIRWNSERK